MTLCDDCIAAERDPHGIAQLWAGRLCCMARAVAATVGRSGKGYTVDEVRDTLLTRFTAGLKPLEAQYVRERAHELIRARKEAQCES